MRPTLVSLLSSSLLVLSLPSVSIAQEQDTAEGAAKVPSTDESEPEAAAISNPSSTSLIEAQAPASRPQNQPSSNRTNAEAPTQAETETGTAQGPSLDTAGAEAAEVVGEGASEAASDAADVENQNTDLAEQESASSSAGEEYDPFTAPGEESYNLDPTYSLDDPNQQAALKTPQLASLLYYISAVNAANTPPSAEECNNSAQSQLGVLSSDCQVSTADPLPNTTPQ